MCKSVKKILIQFYLVSDDFYQGRPVANFRHNWSKISFKHFWMAEMLSKSISGLKKLQFRICFLFLTNLYLIYCTGVENPGEGVAQIFGQNCKGLHYFVFYLIVKLSMP
jgi:hypothetical protein